MLEFDDNEASTRALAIHYSRMLDDDYVFRFMSSRASVANDNEAYRIAKGFWKMTDYAVNDNANGIEIEGIRDLEFWMYQLFNKISGYLKKCGHEAHWLKATNEHSSPDPGDHNSKITDSE